MNLLPKCHEEFSKADYWNTFFKKRGKKAFEWYGEYPELCGQLSKFIKPKDEVLVVGCGNSTLSMDLHDVGYGKVTSIDISKIVIDQMREKNRQDRPNLIFEQMDATKMTYPNESFSVVLDKGTLDALMPDSGPETVERIDKFFGEISRILRRGGRYICISLLQEHILRKIVDYFPQDFMLRVTRCHEAEEKTREEEGSSIPVFVVMATKFPGLGQKVLELALADSPPFRVATEGEFVDGVLAVQQSALVCDRLQKRSVADVGEVNLDLYVAGNDDKPRYTVYVLDRPSTKGRSYAAFLVPQGRDTDWLFGTPEGRRHFLASVDKDRVAIVILRREHSFKDWEEVKTELGPSIKNLSPPGLPPNYIIDYLSLGADVGTREILHQGESKISGKFVVEDVTETDNSRCRRLIFLNNQFVVQSEARIKTIKTRRGKTKNVVDPGILSCEHHAFMSVGISKIVQKKSEAEVLVIGLGGGGLCLFLRHCFPRLRITAVDIDETIVKVATEWFDFVTDERTHVTISDGVEFLGKKAEEGTKYDAILFDVDGKDPSVGMSCPPKQFLGNSVLRNVQSCLQNGGLFILNLVCRNKALKPEILGDLKGIFDSVTSMKIENIVNEVLMCSRGRSDSEEEWKASAGNLNEIVRQRRLLNSDVIDINELVNNLTIN